ncbi:MAG: MBL fold metallo-hydrolase [Pseudomonadota bacterium]
MKSLERFGLLFAGVCVLNPSSAQDFSGVEIKTELVSDHVYVLFGAGGNIGVSAGEDGVFLIDDQYAPLTDKIRAAVETINKGDIRFVLNTHWHGDHVGGNENLAKGGSVVVAHDNVRKRMSVDTFFKTFNTEVKASPKDALPVITYSKDLTLHLNGDTMWAYHVPEAHTDGDSIVFFENANVVHMGDTFFNQMYPFIDVESGGSIKGITAAANKVIYKSDPYTKIIPGHGPVTDLDGLRAYRDMLETIAARLAKMIKDGASLEEIQQSNITDEWEEQWGNGFMKKDRFLMLAYLSLTGGEV